MGSRVYVPLLLLLLLMGTIVLPVCMSAKTSTPWGLGVENSDFGGHRAVGFRTGFGQFWKAVCRWG